MTRFFSALLWAVVFLLVLVCVDQLLVRVPASLPGHVAAATFYRDLRSRLLDLAVAAKTPADPVPAKTFPPAKSPKGAPRDVESVIEQRKGVSPKSAPVKPAARSAGEPAPRYIFADARGELHFADTLAEVPEPYRFKAKRLGEEEGKVGETAPVPGR